MPRSGPAKDFVARARELSAGLRQPHLAAVPARSRASLVNHVGVLPVDLEQHHRPVKWGKGDRFYQTTCKHRPST